MSCYKYSGFEVRDKFLKITDIIFEQEIGAHMALVTRQEELRAKRSYGMSSSKIL